MSIELIQILLDELDVIAIALVFELPRVPFGDDIQFLGELHIFLVIPCVFELSP